MTIQLGIKTLFFLCICLLLSTEALSKSTQDEFSVMPDGFKQPFEFSVKLPKGYEENTEKSYFVIFDMHPKSPLFISGLHDWLSHNGEWPWLQTIVVTPKGYHPEFAVLFEATAEDPSNLRMLNLIEKDILGEVDERYRTNGFRIFSGFMSNGAVGLYALLNKPEMFNAYILSTPSIGNDFLKVESQFAAKLEAVKPFNRFLYMSIGDHGYEKSHVSAFRKIASQLEDKAPKKLDWHAVENAENYYMSRPVIALINGIESLFNDMHTNLPADSDISKQGFEAIVKHYQSLSKDKYGFDVSAEGSLKNLAKSTSESSQEKGLVMYKQVVDMYPDSTYAHSDYAAKLAAVGEIKKAIKYQEIAREKANSLSKWHQNKQQKLLEELTAKLLKAEG